MEKFLEWKLTKIKRLKPEIHLYIVFVCICAFAIGIVRFLGQAAHSDILTHKAQTQRYRYSGRCNCRYRHKDTDTNTDTAASAVAVADSATICQFSA